MSSNVVEKYAFYLHFYIQNISSITNITTIHLGSYRILLEAKAT